MRQIKQWDLRDCGISCLDFLIQYYKGYVPREKLREDTYTTSKGTNAFYLLEALNKYGFDTVGQKISFKELLDAPKPLIAHFVLPNGLEHFMIVLKTTMASILVMDPASGKRKIKKDQFMNEWDGIVLLAVPRTTILQMPKEKSVLAFLKSGLQTQKNKISLLLIISILLSFLTLFYSFYLKITLDFINYANWNSEMLFCIIFFGSLLILKNVFFYANEKIRLFISKDISLDFMYAFLKHMFCLPLEKIKNYREGELLTRVMEAREIKNVFADFFVSLISYSILGLLSLIFLFFLSKELLLLLISGLFFYFLLGYCFAKKIYRLLLKHLEYEANFESSLLESLKMFKTMKHLNKTAEELTKIDQNLSEYEWLSLKENVSLTKISCIKNFGLEIILFALLTYGLYLLSQNELSLINFVTFQSMYMYLMGPLKEVIEVLPKYAYLKGILTKISEYYALEEEDLTKPIVKMVNKKIVIQNLTFAYTPLKENLTNVSLTIESGEHVFLKGPSGSGKSTLCKLLTQEINGYTGNILIGEQNILDYNLASIRANIVYLGQNEELMKTSIKENILYGAHVLNENYHTVCQICHIEEIVSKKGLRHESLVTEINLSGGEKQRILLARTLLKNGEIYLLDEALSEVEKALEKEIILAVRKYLTGKTLIYISHHDEAKLFERVVKIS